MIFQVFNPKNISSNVLQDTSGFWKNKLFSCFKNEGLKSFQVDISQFPIGVYIIKLIDSESNKVFTGKIIKEDD